MADHREEELKSAPSLQTIIRTRYIDEAARDPSRIPSPNPYTSYYRILDFIGRSRELIEHAERNPLDFTWMGATNDNDIIQWADNAYSMLEDQAKNASDESGSSSTSTTTISTQTQGNRNPYMILENQEPIRRFFHGRDGLVPIIERKWRYVFRDFDVYALVISRSSGARGWIIINEEHPVDPTRTVPHARDFDCNIEIIRIKQIRCEETREENLFAEDEDPDEVFTMSEPLERMVTIIGDVMYPNLNEDTWLEHEDIEAFDFESRKDMIKIMQGGNNSVLKRYVDPNSRMSVIDQLASGYIKTENPVVGGWANDACFVAADIHLFRFDLTNPPDAFKWVIDLAAGFWRWKEEADRLKQLPVTSSESRLMRQYYGMRGPVPGDQIHRLYNYREMYSKMLDWMSANRIRVSNRQAYLLRAHPDDYSITSSDLRGRSRSRTAEEELPITHPCSIM